MRNTPPSTRGESCQLGASDRLGKVMAWQLLSLRNRSGGARWSDAQRAQVRASPPQACPPCSARRAETEPTPDSYRHMRTACRGGRPAPRGAPQVPAAEGRAGSRGRGGTREGSSAAEGTAPSSAGHLQAEERKGPVSQGCRKATELGILCFLFQTQRALAEPLILTQSHRGTPGQPNTEGPQL